MHERSESFFQQKKMPAADERNRGFLNVSWIRCEGAELFRKRRDVDVAGKKIRR